MQSLQVKTDANTITVNLSETRVVRRATIMFRRMSADRRGDRVVTSTRRVRGLVDMGYDGSNGAVRHHAAILLSQDVTSV